MQSVEPEREMVRRALPLGAVALLVAFLVGTVSAGPAAGTSAAVGAGLAFANFAANGYMLAWAAGISLGFLGAAAMGGFVVRMGIIFAVEFALSRLAFFSPAAFALGVIPLTFALLFYEMKLLSGPMGREIHVAEPEGGAN